MVTEHYGWPTYTLSDPPDFPGLSREQLEAIEADVQRVAAIAPTLPIVQAGEVNFSVTDGIGSTTVTFPTPFPGVPNIAVSAWSGAQTLKNVQMTNPTTTGFTMIMQRSNDTPTTCSWIAVYTP